jgi:N6-L-threonylcarbamoyladenine synthase
VGINHIQAHIYACGLGLSESIYPCVGFIVSGGHTSLYRCQEPLGWDYLGGTIDDAAGEAFDKVAVMLGLPFPGGPALSKLAAKGDRQAIRFPRPLLEDKQRLDFSFSGLKTAVRYRIAGPSVPSQRASGLDEQERANIAAGFEQAVIDCLIAKAMAAIKKTRATRLCVGGGVAANTSFRDQLALACQARNVELIVAKPQWCTDNAAMGALAWEKIRRGQFDSLDLDVQPGLVRPKR